MKSTSVTVSGVWASLLRKSVCALVLGGLLGGCMPRGETITLDEVLANARTRYSSIKKEGLPTDVTATLTRVEQNLQGFAGESASNGGGSVMATATKVAEDLNVLVNKAGFTSRPALGELTTQYRVIGFGQAGQEISSAQTRLLAARTYSILAAELETARFGL